MWLIKRERTCNIVFTRALVALEVMGSTPVEANILGFNGFVLSVVSDVPVDSETLVMISSISS